MFFSGKRLEKNGNVGYIGIEFQIRRRRTGMHLPGDRTAAEQKCGLHSRIAHLKEPELMSNTKGRNI